MTAGRTTTSYVPTLFAKLGLKEGEWMQASKLTVRALMRPSFPLKVRIWACLLVHSFGYGRDLAVVQVKSDYPGQTKLLPLTPGAIAGMLNKATIEAFSQAKISLDSETQTALKIRKQHISRGLSDMEEDGIIDRFAANCQPHRLADFTASEATANGLGKMIADLPLAARKRIGRERVCIYLRAKPRDVVNLDLSACLEMADRRKKGNPAGLPFSDNSHEINEPIQLSLNFMKTTDVKKLIAVASKKAPREVETALAAYKEMIDTANASLKQFLTTLASSEPATPSQPPAPVATQEQLFTPPRPELVSKPRINSTGEPSGPDVYTVLEAMRAFGPTDEQAAKLLLIKCRLQTPAATAVQVAETIAAKAPLIRRADNPPGFILTAIPRMFEGGPQLTRREPSRAPVCETCGKSTEGLAVIGGQCGDCVLLSMNARTASGD